MGARDELKRELLSTLSERELQVVGLVDMYGYSLKDTARLLGKSSKGVVFWVRLRALKKIRTVYARHGQEGLT